MIQDKLHIVVCLKYTPTSAQFGAAAAGPMAMSPFDEYAVEEGVRLKERLGGKAVVTALTLGPAGAAEGLRDAIARGADEAVLVSSNDFNGSDTYATGYALSLAVQKLSKERGPVDLIVCGKQTNDSDTGQTAAALAVQAGMPCVAFVKKVADIQPSKIVVQRMMDDGAEVLEMPLPALFSIVKEINEPRIPALKGKMAAKKAAIPTWGPAELGLEAGRCGAAGSLVSWADARPVPPRGGGETISGASPQEQAEKLVAKLKSKGLI